MERILPDTHSKSRPIVALAGATLMASVLFVLVPITQKISIERKEKLTVREAVAMTPPAMEAPPEVKEEIQETEPPPKPELQEEFSELNLNQLEMSLNPGIGEALARGLPSQNFNTDVDAVGDIQKIFSFADLGITRLSPINGGSIRFQYPRSLARRGIHKVTVVAMVELNSKGRVKFISFPKPPDPEVAKVAKDIIRQARFGKVEMNGVARGPWSIVISNQN